MKGGGMPMVGRMPGGMPGGAACGGAEICARPAQSAIGAGTEALHKT